MDLFVNPGLLWFSALIAAPIIIYLIHRQHYQRRKWAAMEFLVRALRKSRRRLQLQNLLLLLARILIILLVVLAAARPILRQVSLGSPAGARSNWILVLDISYSMGYREGTSSLFDRARETLIRIADDLVRPDDSVALMTMAHDPEKILARRHLTAAELAEFRAELTRELEDLRLSARSIRLVPALRLLDDLTQEFSDAAGEPEPCKIILFSDLQAKDWLGDDGPRDREAREILEGLRKRGNTISVARLSSDERRLNVAITGLSVRPRLVAREVPVSVSVTVENLGERDAENLDLTLRILAAEELAEDAEQREALLGEVLRLPAGESATRTVSHRFDAAGYHVVSAEVRSDGLVLDNRRFLTIDVEDDLELVLVDGDPSIQLLERETFYLERALQPRDDGAGGLGVRLSPFLPQYVTVDQLGDVDWSRFSVAILADVAEIPPASRRALERFVSEGGALLVFLGDNVRADEYNEQFLKEGGGLLPVPLLGSRGDPSAAVFLQFSDPAHPVARYFQTHESNLYLSGAIVAFFRYFEVDARELPSGVRVLCRFNDLERSPAVFDNAYGRGRVMWFLSSADRSWNDLPVWQDYVVFLYESISYLVGFGTRADNLEVGETFVRQYPGEQFASQVVLRAPSGEDSILSRERVQPLAMREIPGEKRFRISHEDTSIPGIYRLELHRPQSPDTKTVEAFAVNVDPEEGKLRTLSSDDFEIHFGFRPAAYDATEKAESLAEQEGALRGHEYAPWLLFLAVCLLLAETAMAFWFGRGGR